MSTNTKGPAKRPPLPTRAEILAFIAENPGNAGKSEIARAFGIKGSDKIALKALLKEIVADGDVERRGKRLRPPGRLPPVTVLEITGRDRDGELVAVPAEWQEETEGRPPRIVIVPGRQRERGRAPGSRRQNAIESCAPSIACRRQRSVAAPVSSDVRCHVSLAIASRGSYSFSRSNVP